MKSTRNYNTNWGEYFRVDEASPSGLMRIKNSHGFDVKAYSVGTKDYNKNKSPHRWRLGFRGISYLVHRIIWVLTYGSIDPELVIDHLDGNPFNNKIENLSLKTPAGNSRNVRKMSNNSTGITGVSLTDHGDGHFYYKAHWVEIDGSRRSEYFSIAKLGNEVAKTLAIIRRHKEMQRLVNEGADYTERHGT